MPPMMYVSTVVDVMNPTRSYHLGWRTKKSPATKVDASRETQGIEYRFTICIPGGKSRWTGMP